MVKLDSRQILNVDTDPALSKKAVKQKFNLPKVSTPKYNWVPDKVDKRDYVYKPTAVTLPSSVDLREFDTPIENQGPLGSCTGHAIASAIEILYKKSKRFVEISRLFIYYYERLLEGTTSYDAGAFIRDGIKATNKFGAPLETLWPYDISKFKVQPNTSAINDALRRRVTLYERAQNFDSCINALAVGFPVVIGFTAYSSFEGSETAKTGIMTYPNTKSEKALGGHAVLLVGYDNSHQRFIVKNSWGPNWGDNGYFYMPYSVIKNPNMSSDFWVIKSVNVV